MVGPIFLPQPRQRHPLATELGVDLGPIGLGALARSPPIAPIQPLVQGRIRHRVRPRPLAPFTLEATDEVAHGGVMHPVGPGNGPVTESQFIVQAKDLANPIHG